MFNIMSRMQSQLQINASIANQIVYASSISPLMSVEAKTAKWDSELVRTDVSDSARQAVEEVLS